MVLLDPTNNKERGTSRRIGHRARVQDRGMECSGTSSGGVLHAVCTVTSSRKTEYHTWYGVQSRDSMVMSGGWSAHTTSMRAGAMVDHINDR